MTTDDQAIDGIRSVLYCAKADPFAITCLMLRSLLAKNRDAGSVASPNPATFKNCNTRRILLASGIEYQRAACLELTPARRQAQFLSKHRSNTRESSH